MNLLPFPLSSRLSSRPPSRSGGGFFTGAALLLCAAFASLADMAAAETKNGFDLSRATIPADEIFQGGPPRDGIPAIDAPVFIAADDAAADFLRDEDIVIGVEVDGVARAYPTRILVWHEIVNDTIGETAFAVTYCPLCGTAMVFDRTIDGAARRFGVSGLLYQSDVLMYDRESDSLWSQLAMRAVSGDAAGAGATLKWLPAEHLTWAAWRARHPQGEVLSTETGYRRDYNGNPYADYFSREETMFPVPRHREEFSNKTWVIGVVINGEAKAYPIDALPPAQRVDDEVGGRRIQVEYHPKNRQPIVRGDNGEALPAVLVFWFAWQAFYPATAVWGG